MKQDLISVIIPIYKVDKYLDKAIESVVGQTYRDLEIILVDDGSPDNCPQICDNWATKDDRIKVIHQQNAGVSVARNTALDIIKGKYIFFLDSDDYLSLDAIELLHSTLIDANVDMCMGNYLCVDENYEALEETEFVVPAGVPIRGIERFRYIISSTHFQVVCNNLFKASLFEGIRFPVGVSNGEDTIVASKIFYKFTSFIFVNNYTYYYLQRSDSAVSKRNFLDVARGLDELFFRLEYYRNNKELKQFERYEIDKIFYRLDISCKNFDYKGEYKKEFKEVLKKSRYAYKGIDKSPYTLMKRAKYSFFLFSPSFFFLVSKFLASLRAIFRKKKTD